MVSIAGSKKLKRQMAPGFWKIARKGKRFVVTVKAGAHPKAASIPSAVLLRDTLGLVSTLREAKASIYSGGVTIDGIKRKSLHHGVGLMDIVELGGSGQTYRMVPGEGVILRPLKVDADQKGKKICKVTSKVTIRGGKTQLGLHDGRSIITDEKANVGDSCLIEVPGQKILEVIRLEKGAHVMVTKGANAGQLGTLNEVRPGTFVLPKIAAIKLDDKEIEIPTGITMAVGKDGPVVQVS